MMTSDGRIHFVHEPLDRSGWTSHENAEPDAIPAKATPGSTNSGG